MEWRRYTKLFMASLLLLMAGTALAIIVLDPYANLPFRPLVKTWPIASNQRYSYPAIARDAQFNSALLGTSTSHLLRPDTLNEALGTRIANLSMSSATAYEQTRLYEVFLRAHSKPNTLLIGLDVVWCETGSKLEKYTFRRFPKWLYDENPWNDYLNFLEVRTFNTLFRKARFLLGLRGPRFGSDGYYDFLPPVSQYDLTKARQHLGTDRKQRLNSGSLEAGKSEKIEKSWNFPTHDLLRELIEATPEQTKKVLVFVPYHHLHLPRKGTAEFARWQSCKTRIRDLMAAYKNSAVLDFMIPSPITKRDENYWDPLHYNRQVAEQFARLIGRGAKGLAAPNGEYEILLPPK